MYSRSRTFVTSPVVFLLLIGVSAWAQEAERFTLLDGRVLVGTYDPVTRIMRAQTTAGEIVFVLEPERIASRAPVSVATVAETSAIPEVKATTQTREYYVREKRRLDEQLRQDRRSLVKELGASPTTETYLQLREQLFELKRHYDATDLAFRLEQDGERKRALGEQWAALDRQYSNLLEQMRRIEGEQSIVREQMEHAERIYREQLGLLEMGWVRDGYGRLPIH